MNTTLADAPQIEVLTGPERRRQWSVEVKVRLVEELNKIGMSVSYVARKYRIAPSQLFMWRRRMAEGSREQSEPTTSATEVRELNRQVRELQRVLGKKTMENEILRDAVQIAQEEKLILQLPSLPPDDMP